MEEFILRLDIASMQFNYVKDICTGLVLLSCFLLLPANILQISIIVVQVIRTYFEPSRSILDQLCSLSVAFISAA